MTLAQELIERRKKSYAIIPQNVSLLFLLISSIQIVTHTLKFRSREKYRKIKKKHKLLQHSVYKEVQGRNVAPIAQRQEFEMLPDLPLEFNYPRTNRTYINNIVIFCLATPGVSVQVCRSLSPA
jgi:hypothetical protein